MKECVYEWKAVDEGFKEMPISLIIRIRFPDSKMKMIFFSLLQKVLNTLKQLKRYILQQIR